MTKIPDERHVPLIDMSQSDVPASQELFKALSTVGFACLINTGIWDMAHEYANLSKEFFELPSEEKKKYGRPVSLTDNGGWVAIGREKLSGDRPGDYKECFNMMRDIRSNPQRSPSLLDNEKCWSLWADFETLSNRVLHLIGLGLNLDDPQQLEKTHNYSDALNNRSAQRLAWYPKVDKGLVQPGQIRCGEHSDYGSITLLYSSAPGLQVVNRQTGDYVDAGYVEGGIFVNIGDLLQMWSGDVLVANKHRVLIPDEKYADQDRVSIAFFCQPDNDVLIETLDGSAKYRPVTAGGWLTERFQATYDKK